MPNYLVIWRIDIETDTPAEAALAALAIQRKPDSWAVVFDVKDKASGAVTTIDLEPDTDCFPCQSRGWDIVFDDTARGELGEIQRCDDCRQLPDDFAACRAARAAGFLVSDDYQILAYPSGFLLDAWRQGRWPAPEGDAGRG
jgi:hypothetical protein